MSGWTILTVRGKYAKNYEYSRHDEKDPWDATSDIVASMDEDGRIYKWTVWSSHVYAYLKNCGRYDFSFAESILEDYDEQVRDAVVLGANDTTDTGTARYYPNAGERWTDKYRETQTEDGTYVGEIALAVMNARHGIVARDPFHNQSGLIDDNYLESGQVRADVE